MRFVYDDGGRTAAGFKGIASDCVARAVAIASGKPYAEIYRALGEGAGSERKSRGKSARNGIHVRRKWFKDFMKSLGFRWVPTMGIGTGCKVHLHDDELPNGRLVVRVSKHSTAVIDGVVHDIYDPQREVHAWYQDKGFRIERRCVYGYWIFEGVAQ